MNNGQDPVIAYISAINSVLNKRGQFFAYIEVPDTYKDKLKKDTIIENYLKLTPLKGLVNLLLNEQGYIRIGVDVDEDGRKTIGDIVKTTKKNIRFTCDLSEPIKYKKTLPVQAPIINMIKTQLGVESEVGKADIFDEALKNKIVDYRVQNKIEHGQDITDIDTPLLRAIFPQCKIPKQEKTGPQQTATVTQQPQTSFSLKNFGFRQILDEQHQYYLLWNEIKKYIIRIVNTFLQNIQMLQIMPNYL